MEKQIFKIFGKVLITDKPKVTQAEMLAVSMPLGFFVPEELCYEWLWEYFKVQQWNPNSTFYQSWEDIKSKDRWELFIDQVRHYASTYGTDFQGETWLPEHTQLPAFPFRELKVVEGISEYDARQKTLALGYSNIAMSTEVLDFLINSRVAFELDKVKNRELKLRLIPDDYQFKDGQECLLWILWKSCNITMLVKSKEVLDTIRIPASMLKTIELNKPVLASVFYRNKDVFMQFKKTPELKNVVNRIRKCAGYYHKPMEKSPWLMLDKLSPFKRHDLFKKASIFKLVQMYNALSNPTGYYVIRNGKAYYRDGRTRQTSPALLAEIRDYIAIKVVNKHMKDGVIQSVALPKGIELAMPMSEKSFIGDIPMGSYVDCAEKNTMIGIYWRNEWGARDLDLHAKLTDGTTIGWNSRFKDDNKSVIFSGDMTNADPEATEVMWFKEKPMDSIISVSEYSGHSKYNYDIFIAQELTTDFHKSYMVDPRNVIYRTNLSLENAKDVTLGFFQDGKFVFHSCQIGKGQIPNEIRTTILDHLISCHYLTVREVFERAGITVSDDAETKLMSKGDLLEFFS